MKINIVVATANKARIKAKVIFALSASTLDVYFTVLEISKGMTVEANPLLHVLNSAAPVAIVAGIMAKLVLTGVGVAFLADVAKADVLLGVSSSASKLANLLLTLTVVAYSLVLLAHLAVLLMWR